VFATYLVDFTSFGHLASRAAKSEQVRQISATGSCFPALALHFLVDAVTLYFDIRI
jgi:hypothetical protein